MLTKQMPAAPGAISQLARDGSVSAVVAGLIAVTVSYAGPLLVVFQAAKTANLSDPLLSSWIWAISLSSGLAGVILSLWLKTPVITAWSTPGAVLLVSGWSAYAYSDAIGAFVFSGLLATLLGLSGLFSAIIQRIPSAIIAAMLAGILLKFGVDVFIAANQLPVLAVPMILCYFFAKRYCSRYAVAATLLAGLSLALLMNAIDYRSVSIALVKPVLTMPTVSLEALLGLGLPLCIVTMSAQNATGIGLLKLDGYQVPASPLVAVTGIFSVLFAPFGSHGINLAAITAAICTGKEAHYDPSKRYIAGIVCGLFYILLSAFGATLASIFAALPSVLVAVIAGLALLGSLTSSLTAAIEGKANKEGALITFLVTLSGITVAGIGAPFWGLLAGMAADYILTSKQLLLPFHKDAMKKA